jgi:carbon storage regulator
LKNESIVLGDTIILKVIEIRGDQVRLGVEHPQGATVHRKEIYEALRRHEEDGGDN